MPRAGHARPTERRDAETSYKRVKYKRRNHSSYRTVGRNHVESNSTEIASLRKALQNYPNGRFLTVYNLVSYMNETITTERCQ